MEKSDSNKNIIETKELSFSYGNSDGNEGKISRISLTIPKGKKTVFLGPNGAGKSTLFLCLNGVNRPDSGKLFFAGKEVKYDQKALSSLREKVVLVFQNPDDQIFSATVEEDVAFGPLNLGLSRDEVERRVDEAISWVGIESLRGRPTTDLSFGQRKRVSLAGALAMKPEVIIMDEPTAGLDNEIVHELLELSDELNRKGLTVAMSTHDIETAYEWADEVRALEKGRLVFSGKTGDFFSDDELVHRLGFLRPAPLVLDKELELITGKKSSPPSRSILEFSEKVLSHKGRHGKITLVPVLEDGGKIPANHNRSGIYGSVARRISKKGLLDVHYRFHAIEKAVFEARRGGDFTIFSEGILLPLIREKLLRLCPKARVETGR